MGSNLSSAEFLRTPVSLFVERVPKKYYCGENVSYHAQDPHLVLRCWSAVHVHCSQAHACTRVGSELLIDCVVMSSAWCSVPGCRRAEAGVGEAPRAEAEMAVGPPRGPGTETGLAACRPPWRRAGSLRLACHWQSKAGYKSSHP